MRLIAKIGLPVIDGNYKRMTGVCPWWDAVKQAVDRSDFTAF
jgi:hypothetical protein